jgi:hypothetical protein
MDEARNSLPIRVFAVEKGSGGDAEHARFLIAMSCILLIISTWPGLARASGGSLQAQREACAETSGYSTGKE